MDFLKPENFVSHDEVKNILNEIIDEEKTPLKMPQHFPNMYIIISLIKKASPMSKPK